MLETIFLILGIIVVVIVLLFVFARREAGKHQTSTGQELVGICLSAIETTSQKEGRKQRALEMLREQGELSNSEIREELGVASRTVVKYMSELESEGKVKQVGDVGRGVVYSAVK